MSKLFSLLLRLGSWVDGWVVGELENNAKHSLELKWKLSLAKIENLDSWLIYGGFCLKTFFF